LDSNAAEALSNSATTGFGAATPLIPICILAIYWAFSQVAINKLTGIARTGNATVLRHLLEATVSGLGAGTTSDAAAGVLRPVGPDAIHWAIVLGAFSGVFCASFAGLALALSHHLDLAGPNRLSTTTGELANAPICPVSPHAIDIFLGMKRCGNVSDVS